MSPTRMAAEMVTSVLAALREVATHALKADDLRIDAFAEIADELERARKSEDSMAAALKAMEWSRRGNCCPTCFGPKGEGHGPTCALDAALRPFR